MPDPSQNPSRTSAHCPQGQPTYPAAGKKRTITDQQDSEPHQSNSPIDFSAIYAAHKPEIDTWYDEQHSLRLGIPKHNKLKHSTAQWFIKVDAWMQHTGQLHPAAKKRKLAAPSTVQPPQPTRPDQVRYPNDRVPVPERPFDQLRDFEQMPNGRYACSHVNRHPPMVCCVHGLSKQQKRQAITKSVKLWRERVERLIDQKQLSVKHKTWEGWVTVKLRRRHRPEAFRELERRRREGERLQVRRWAERDGVVQGEGRTDRPRQQTSADAHEVGVNSFSGVAQQPIQSVPILNAPVRRLSSSNDAGVNVSVTDPPFKIWDLEGTDGELDRILATGSVEIVETVPQATTSVLSEATRLTTLQETFANGNPIVDNEVRRLLKHAYEPGTPTWQSPSEDERLLEQMIEESRADWQRYCDFLASSSSEDEQTAAHELQTLAGRTDVVGSDFGELPHECG